MPRFSPGNGEIIDRMPLIVPSEGLISWRGGIGGYPSIPMMNCNVPRYSIFPYHISGENARSYLQSNRGTLWKL